MVHTTRRTLLCLLALVLSALLQVLVKVNMSGSVFYGKPRRRYGPGQGIEVPEGLARTLGLTPIEEKQEGRSPTKGDATSVQQSTGQSASAPPAPNVGGEPPPGDNKAFWAGLALTGEQGAALQEAGLDSVEALRAADDETILAVPHIGKATLEKIRAAVEE